MRLPATVLVTGATGFVGSVLCAQLESAGVVVRRHARRPAAGIAVSGELGAITDWTGALDGVDAVVHLAALTHSGGLRSAAARKRYFAVNLAPTQTLAAAAAAAGVRHFVFMSSIKVNGEGGPAGRQSQMPYSGIDVPAPQDNYGTSKLAAENAVIRQAANSDMAATILRPPLIYGPGCAGNFRRLMRWVAEGRVLPLGGIRNQRSLVYVDNLAQAVVAALATPATTPRILTLADVNLSVPAMVARMADALGTRARLVALPSSLLRVLRALPLSGGVVRRLCDDLVVDSRAAGELLGWQPAVATDEAFARTARWLQDELA